MRSDIAQEISKSRWKSNNNAKVATETEIMMLMRELLDDIYGFYYAGGQM